MNTTYETTQNQNVSTNERAFRAVFGMGMLTAISAGTIVSTTVIFVVSMVAVYQVITAIIGIDPVYSLVHGLAQRLSVSHYETAQARA